MYQVPVKDVAKLRRSRKRVKSILCDIALEDCQELVKKFKPYDAGEHCFNNTEWIDFTDGSLGKRKKKWRYRTQALCCSLCWFSTRSFYTFRSHVQRCHEEEMDIACLSACPKCTFISHPKVTEQHMKFFHTMPPKAPAGPSATSTLSTPFTPSTPIPPIQAFGHPANAVALTAAVTAAVSASETDGDRYTCLNCGYHDSLLYVMKKHVLVNHYATLLNRYFGHKVENAQKAFGSTKKAFITAPKYYCKECKLPAETIEHLLYHILSSEKHIDLLWHIMPFIREKFIPNQKYAEQQKFLAPKVMQHSLMVTRPNFMQQTKAVKGNLVPKSNGTMLVAGPANTTLLCPSARPVFLSSQPSALVPGTSVSTLQNAHQQSSTLPTSTAVNSINMVVPSMSQDPSNQVPVTMAVPTLPSAQAAQQVLLPPGVQVNLPGKIGVRSPMLMTPRLNLNQPSPRQSLMASQSVRLIPTGNKVNGVPTYTLAPVQVGSVQANSGQVVKSTPVVLSQNGSPARSPPETTLLDASVGPAKATPSGQKQTMRKINKPNELAVLAPFLKIQSNHTVKCLRCNVLLTEQWIFQHLLHGLKCLFCPLMFYSFKQIMDHTNKEHNLKVKKNRDFIKKEFQLSCDDEGNLVFATFNLNTDVPKDLLDNRELNLVLVTSTQEKIYIKMYPHSAKAVYPPTQKSTPTDCPFCRVKLRSSEDYERCRCAPKNVKDAERQLNPDPTVYLNGNIQNPIQQRGNSQAQRGEKEFGKLKTEGTSERNGRGRNSSNASVVLELDPTGMEMKSFEDRKEFLTKYFHRKPYPSRVETQVLAKRLWMNKADILFHFSTRRTRCMKVIQKKTTAVLLGFNMTEVNKVKHNLLIPEVAPIMKSEVNE
ncbi:activity-dependent neuroprotective protein 2a isoform X2 [Salminus brasiliensis]|uniref:activity-dependent neuroprotective protein 2a isoform X2 n=1 Tax=Salminus brasiliensis TaxID=930266 RepID=UPI003B8393B3